MAYFSGRVKMKDLFTSIVNDIKGIIDSPWTIHYESTTKITLKSQGSSGTDVMFTEISRGNTTSTNGNYLVVGVSDGIDSSTGNALTNSLLHTKNFLCHTSAVDNNLLIDYQISIKPDRIILWVQGDVNSVTGISNMAYLGLMKRYAIEVDSNAHCMGVSYNGDNGVRTIRDKNGLTTTAIAGASSNVYDAFATLLPANPGWGDLYHVSPIVMANNTEGARGELYDVFAISSAGVSHGDEITIATKVHKIFNLSAGGNTFLPGTTVAVQMN